MDQAIDFSLVIACYEEEPHLWDNVLALYQYFSALRYRVEFVFVEDASTDQTMRELQRCLEFLRGKEFPTQAIFHKKNQGRGFSVQEGFLAARGATCGFIDIDLEHPVDAILPMLLSVLNNQCDAVVARRISDKRTINPIRTIASLSYRGLAHFMLKLPVSDSESGLKVFNRTKLLPVLRHVHDTKWFWDTEIVYQAHKHGLRFQERPIVFVKNPKKKSTVHVVRDSIIYFQTLLRFSLAERRGARATLVQPQPERSVGE